MLAVALGGCGKKSDDFDQFGGVALAAAPQEIAKAVCPKAYTCCTPPQLMGNDLAGTDEPSCETKTTAGFKQRFDSLKGSLEKGRSVYRGDKLQKCVDFIRSATCQQLNRTNHFSGLECESWIEPKVAEGGACNQDYECTTGFCSKEPKAWEGVCKPAAVLGQSCEGPPCAKGLTCDGATKTCVSPAASPGTADPPPAMCFYSSACSYGEGRLSPFGLLAVAALALTALGRRRRR
jgi:hypothetical protein